MTIYIDIVILINAFFDFLLLQAVNSILKRKVKLLRLLIVSIVSSSTVFLMFININIILLNIIKLIISIIMIVATFKYNNIKYFISNLFYFYLIGIFLGGFLYFINNSLSNSLYLSNKLNNILVPLIGIIGIFIYKKQPKAKYDNYYNVTLYFKNHTKEYTGYYDSGNVLKDYITKLPVIFINEEIKDSNYYYVNYKTIKGGGIIKCYKARIKINNCIKKVLVSYIDSINIDGVSCILNKEII